MLKVTVTKIFVIYVVHKGGYTKEGKVEVVKCIAVYFFGVSFVIAYSGTCGHTPNEP